MKYVWNGVPEDDAKLTFEGLMVPLCELTDEEYMKIVFGIREHAKRSKKGSSGQSIYIEASTSRYDSEPVDILDLSVRPAHCLAKAGIITIGQLCALTECELSKIRNMGVKSVSEVKKKLESLGLELKTRE